MKFTEEVRDLILQRSRGVCDICGMRTTAYHLHHRHPRSMGGSLQSIVGSAANGLLLHPNCHEAVERNRKKSVQNGWLIRSGGLPPEIPVRLWSGWVLLGTDGSMVETSPKDRAGLGML